MYDAIFGVWYPVYNTKYGIARLFMLNFCKFLTKEAVDDFWLGLFFGEAEGH